MALRWRNNALMWIHRWRTPNNRRLPTHLYSEPNRPCFITVRAYQRQVPFVRPDLNRAIVSQLLDDRVVSACALYAYCLMPDHLHLLAAPHTIDASVLHFTDRFKGNSTRTAWSIGFSGKLWQPRSYDHVLRTGEAVKKVCEYIVNNPVRRGLVADARDYPWSGMPDPLPEGVR